MKESAVTVKQAADMSPEQLKGKFIRGVHVERDQPEFIEVYDKLAEELTTDSSVVNQNLRATIESYQRLGNRLKARIE
jgi:hypothetical protein